MHSALNNQDQEYQYYQAYIENYISDLRASRTASRVRVRATAEASSGGRDCSAKPKPYEVSGGLAELLTVINVKTEARGASPSLFCFTNRKVQNRPSSEPDALSNPIDSWRMPNIPLIDDDGAADGHAKEGVADSDEDGIKNCLDYDSDDDGVYDGTELGVTVPVPGTDEIKGIDIDSLHFVIDSDPSTTTDPTEPDDDGDHLLDGLEDKNHNGAFDDGETDPLEVDTDSDGLYDGSEENQYGYSGEDSNDNGIVDDDESDPRKKDTDGDGLWDGDEVAPEYIDYDKYENRYNYGFWYSSDPFDVDSDGDGLNDDQEIIGWDVRIFWEATLETVKGPYEVFSDPDMKDTDDDGLEDDQEFAYGADPDEDDTDNDNVDDDVEVDRGDNPCGIEGRPPEITKLEVSAVPVVDDYQGTPYLKGWDVTVAISAEDSAGPYKFALKVLGGLPVEVELQEEKEDGYYKTKIDGSATVYVENDGGWDYCSAFITSTEDSVGNVLGTYIIGEGLPQYSNNILSIINDGEDAVNYNRDVSGVEYESVPGDIMNVEIIDWLAEKIIEKIQYIMERIKIDADDYNKSKIVQFAFGSTDKINENTDEILDFIDNFNWTYGVQNEGKTRGKLAGYYTYDEALDYLISLADLIIEYDYSQNRNLCNFLYVHFLELFEENLYIDKDEDGLALIWEKIYGTSDENSPDYDGDELLDGKEFLVTFKTNVVNGKYNTVDTSNFISVDGNPWKKGVSSLWRCYYYETEDHLYQEGDKLYYNGMEHIVLRTEFIGYTTEGYKIDMIKIEIEDWKDWGFHVLMSIEINKNIYAIYENLDIDNSYPNPKESLRELIIKHSDPKNPDTDDDDMSDGFEVNIFRTSPITFNDKYGIFISNTGQLEYDDAYISNNLSVNQYGYDTANIAKYKEKSATKANFENAINSVASETSINDIVYINIASHAYTGGIYLEDGDLSYSRLDSWLDRINCYRLIIVIDACYSGSALNKLEDGDNPCPRVIYMSCKSDEESYGTFNYRFSLALGYQKWPDIKIDLDSYYDADANFGNGDGYVSVREAFLYAADWVHTHVDADFDGEMDTALESDDALIWDTTYLGEFRI